MRRRADGQTHLHRVAHTDALEKRRQQDRAENTGDDDGDRRDRFPAGYYGQSDIGGYGSDA